MKSFNVPVQYRSSLVSAIKQKRKAEDKMKKDFSPAILEIGSLKVILARHFGFCYGVENAIEIAFRAVEENPDKRVFLLSEMIHNPGVNSDLVNLGVQFIMDTSGNMLRPWEELNADDIVIIPAFGTTREMENQLRLKGIEPTLYETTCPFVEKVWNRAEKIGKDGYTVIVHGKPKHEETRATFSHSMEHTPTVVVKDLEEAKKLADYITGKSASTSFYTQFKGQYSEGFDVEKDLKRIGVVNQTTMLASETQGIADYLRQVMISHYNLDHNTTGLHFADTRDTLCYATNDNQSAVRAMLDVKADLAIVIGGYNSSNTSHLVELFEQHLPTFFIKDESCLASSTLIHHFNWHAQEEVTTEHYLPQSNSIKVMITSGASCPDALVERVIARMAALTNNEQYLDEAAAVWVD